MKQLRTGMICCVLILQCVASWAVYGVRISDLNNGPIPPNPIRVWGKVTSEVPLKISDGRAEIVVKGWAASVGVYLTLIGNWNGQIFTAISADHNLTTEMIFIPAGSFNMGTPESYLGNHMLNEHPQHSVTLSGYYIGKYEVTRGEYRQFMNAGGYSNPSFWSTEAWYWKEISNTTEPSMWAAYQDWSFPYNDGNGFTQTDNHPAIGLTYFEAEAFCNWAGGHLPTEAQWERAARWTGSNANVYPWGDTWDVQKCNNPDDTLYPRFQTVPVGSYSSGVSPSGCHDMAGNAYEWCKDWYLNTYYSTSPGSDPLGPSSGMYRIMRGGSWDFGESYSRCANRSYNGGPYSYSGLNGLRLAR